MHADYDVVRGPLESRLSFGVFHVAEIQVSPGIHMSKVIYSMRHNNVVGRSWVTSYATATLRIVEGMISLSARVAVRDEDALNSHSALRTEYEGDDPGRNSPSAQLMAGTKADLWA